MRTGACAGKLNNGLIRTEGHLTYSSSKGISSSENATISRQQFGQLDILVNNAGIMIIKQVLFKIIVTLFTLAYIAALFSL